MFKSVNDGKLPTKGSEHSACVDLYANQTVLIKPGETKLIPLGVSIDLASNKYIDLTQLNKEVFLSSHYLQLMLRSSMGAKGLISPHGVGIIDLDYKDEIKLIIHNPYNNNQTKNNQIAVIKKNDRIAQITLLEHKAYLFDIHSTETRSGGFGSTN